MSLTEFSSSGGGGGADLSLARKAPETQYDTESIQSAGAASIADQYGAAAVVAQPARKQSLRPAPGREVTDLSLPNTNTESFHPEASLDPHAPHANGTLDTHGGSRLIQPLDSSLDHGAARDKADSFEGFVHHDVDGKTHSTGLDISGADQVIQPLQFALDQGTTRDAGNRQSFVQHKRDSKTHSTGFNVGRAHEIIKPISNYDEAGWTANEVYNPPRASQTYRSIKRGVQPPPVRKRKKVPKARKQEGFTNGMHKTGRGSVWNEMGMLKVEPYDQRRKGTRGMDLDDVAEVKKKPNEKVNYNRMAELARSKREVVSTSTGPISPKEEYRRKLNQREPYQAKSMYWKPPQHFRVFDPSDYARDRNAKIEVSRLQNWTPDKWNSLPEFCYKPTRDTGECD